MKLSDSDHGAYFLEAVLKHMEHEGRGSEKRFKRFLERMMDLKDKRPNDPSDPVLQDIWHMLSPHPYLIQEFNSILPPSCRLEHPTSQDTLKSKVLEDGLNFIRLIRERVSVNEYKTFVHLLSEPNSGNESVSEIEKLLSQHDDLVAEFEAFKPLPKRMSRRRRVTQQEKKKLDDVNRRRKLQDKMHDADVEVRRYRTLADEIQEFLQKLHTKDEIGRLEIRLKDHFSTISIRYLKNLYGESEDKIGKLLKENGGEIWREVMDHLSKAESKVALTREEACVVWPQLDLI